MYIHPVLLYVVIMLFLLFASGLTACWAASVKHSSTPIRPVHVTRKEVRRD